MGHDSEELEATNLDRAGEIGELSGIGCLGEGETSGMNPDRLRDGPGGMGCNEPGATPVGSAGLSSSGAGWLRRGKQPGNDSRSVRVWRKQARMDVVDVGHIRALKGILQRRLVVQLLLGLDGVCS